ncbi:MAG: cytochrome c [Rhodospirillaceae bacterium]|nr:cytochrome c [Rhodospirillaceae bacterium]
MKLLMALLAAVPVLAAPALAAEGSAQRGAELYVTVGCYQCHGYAAQGGAAGPRLAPDPLPFAAFESFVRTTDQIMPPYTLHALPARDMADIYAFLLTIPEPPKEIPLLSAE